MLNAVDFHCNKSPVIVDVWESNRVMILEMLIHSTDFSCGYFVVGSSGSVVKFLIHRSMLSLLIRHLIRNPVDGDGENFLIS